MGSALTRAMAGGAMIAAVSSAAQAQDLEEQKDKALPRLEVQSGGFDLRLTAGAASQGAVFNDDDPLTDSPDAKVDLVWDSRDPVPTDAGFSILPTAMKFAAPGSGAR